MIEALKALNHFLSGHQLAGEVFVVTFMFWPLWVSLAGFLIIRRMIKREKKS